MFFGLCTRRVQFEVLQILQRAEGCQLHTLSSESVAEEILHVISDDAVPSSACVLKFRCSTSATTCVQGRKTVAAMGTSRKPVSGMGGTAVSTAKV